MEETPLHIQRLQALVPSLKYKFNTENSRKTVPKLLDFLKTQENFNLSCHKKPFTKTKSEKETNIFSSFRESQHKFSTEVTKRRISNIQSLPDLKNRDLEYISIKTTRKILNSIEQYNLSLSRHKENYHKCKNFRCKRKKYTEKFCVYGCMKPIKPIAEKFKLEGHISNRDGRISERPINKKFAEQGTDMGDFAIQSAREFKPQFD
ncbi:unnamed protein product [Blepharisma stoltei]|uniref:Uncharacterized protein n=1 Tax=Blepharisma stoltei TaxID=1481888 RepID=A0AAU9IT11_9CILI|nr:unnamed protein product [Blepharisma stoltei]